MSRIRTAPPAWPLLAAALIALAACNRGDASSGTSSTSSGDVAYASFESLEAALGGEVSSEQYRRWLAAKQALDRVPNLPPPVKASGSTPTEEDIEAAIARLESNARARAAIEGAGMSVREYVLTTVALDRAMAATSRSRTADPAPIETYPPSVPYPGANYPGTYPPGTYPPGTYPPGAYPPPAPLPGTVNPQPPVYTPTPAPVPVQPRPTTPMPVPVEPTPQPQPTPTPTTPPPSPTPQPTPEPVPPPTTPAPSPTPSPAPPPPPTGSSDPAPPPDTLGTAGG